MRIPFYQVDAFTDKAFGGNPAALCILQDWPDDRVMQNIAIENNLAETAFIIRQQDAYAIRWFTNLGEINLCGHATLAAAHVVLRHLNYRGESVRFTTREVGDLVVTRDGAYYAMDFPAWVPVPMSCSSDTAAGLGGVVPLEILGGRDYLFVFADAATVKTIQPDYKILQKLGRRISITAPGTDCDFVSRFFCPGDAVEEDPVTGSAHCMLVPYWAQRLGKTDFVARQFSARGVAEIRCALRGNRVALSGQAVTVIEGVMTL